MHEIMIRSKKVMTNNRSIHCEFSIMGRRQRQIVKCALWLRLCVSVYSVSVHNKWLTYACAPYPANELVCALCYNRKYSLYFLPATAPASHCQRIVNCERDARIHTVIACFWARANERDDTHRTVNCCRSDKLNLLMTLIELICLLLL